ncbi:hypothetical protein ACPPVO_35745 [Dactylosporangium sp. McL0621]
MRLVRFPMPLAEPAVPVSGLGSVKITKAPLNAFQIAFEGRLTPANH